MGSCKRENEGRNIYSLSPSSNDYKSGFEIEKIITIPHSFIGVEFVYYTSEKFYMSVLDGTS